MADTFRALCAELAEALERAASGLNNSTAQTGYRYVWAHEAFQAAARARAALAKVDEPAAPAPPADTYYEWELEDAHGEWQAGGSSNSQTDVECEGMHYLQGYAQDGAHKLIIRQHTTQTINEITNG